MKAINFSSIILSFYFAFCLLFIGPLSVYAEDAPIHIEANRMTSTERTNSVVFIGDVDAKQGDVRIRSDKMTVYYTEADKDKNAEKKASQQVEKLVCIGNVEIIDTPARSNQMTIAISCECKHRAIKCFFYSSAN